MKRSNQVVVVLISFCLLLVSQPAWSQDLPFAANEGITGSWFNPETDGQGFLIEMSPTLANTVVMYWFTYDPTSDGPSFNSLSDHFWLIGVGTLNDNEADITFSLVTGGTFNQGGGINSDDGWATGNLQVNSCTDIDFSFQFPPEAGGQSGTIPLTRLTPDLSCAGGGTLPAPEAYAGTFEGMWHNTTFGSTGSVRIVITYDADTEEYTITEDYGGNVFGGSNPPPVTSTASEVSFGIEESNITNNSTFGDCTTTTTDAGRFRGSCSPPAFDEVLYEGVESPSHITWTYTIMDNGSVFAEGNVIAWRVQ